MAQEVVKHMIEKTAEEISSLMDDELDEHSRARVVHKMKDDDEMKSRWEHYHLIGEALRNNLPEIIHPDLANRINNILHQEPSYQFPQNISAQTARRAPRNRAVTGFAIAASLAVVTVLGFQQLTSQNELPGQQQLVTMQEITAVPHIASQEASPTAVLETQAVASLDPLPLPLPKQTVDLRVKEGDPASLAVDTRQVVDTRFYDYLIHHNEYAVTMPVQGGMVPYARMVGYASDE